MNRFSLAIAVSVGFILASPALAQPPWADEVGYTQLLNEFGLVGNGTGVVVAQVEAGANFVPDSAHAQFSGKTIFQASPGSSTPSGHATNVGINFYGNTLSIAGGVTNISAFSANDWLVNQLGFDPLVPGPDPLPQNFAVSNHSYIFNALPVDDATNLLQRIDFAVNQTEMITVVGLNNGSGNPQPQGLGQAYNVISVGISDGNHSRGTTTLYGVGRTKPDIVAPANTTSIGTAIVSSAATLLYDAANSSNATRSETMKAILLAGATKSEFADWDRTTTRPLDDIYGAGELNVYNSYRILAGGEADGSTSEPTSFSPLEAFDYNPSISPTAPVYYDFFLPNGGVDLSVVLDWNIDVIDQDNGGTFVPTTSLADMSLRLYDSTGGFLGSLLDSSLSPVDNVEHIYWSTLDPGRYTLQVSSNLSHDYGIAWRVRAIPEPGTWLLLTVACGLMIFGVVRRRRQRLVPVEVPVKSSAD